MPLSNIFKSKKKEKKPPEEKNEKKPVKKEKDKPSQPAQEKKREKKSNIGQAYRILKSPHITEKAGDVLKENQYIFRVFPRTNKIEIKKAIEASYGVDVISVKIINTPEKKRRLGKIKGVRPGYKKAIVKIKKDQKIEVLPG